MFPKIQNPKQLNLGDFRHIALGNIEGKKFYQHLAGKNNLKGSFQKIMAGCG